MLSFIFFLLEVEDDDAVGKTTKSVDFLKQNFTRNKKLLSVPTQELSNCCF